SPMTIRFFILQAHYRSTVDFSNEALQAAEKGLERLMDAWHTLQKLTPADATTAEVKDLRQKCDDAMNDDLNSPIVIAHLLDACRAINSIAAGTATITAADLQELRDTFSLYCFDILGLREDAASGNAAREEAYAAAVDMLLAERQKAKAAKDWATSDAIRNQLTALGFEIKDGKNGAEWKLNK
ncbi:MAG: cysteine--tRNA ligase, partial [Bacteroidaceae bacterium]|nr:cysteine--tRNA ligase [Bacteroidaceae bacterium]